MSSILTNNSAMVALQTLKSINSDLSKTQAEISTGKSVGSAKDNSALWAISKVMESDVNGFKAISESLSLGQSTVSVGRQASETVTDLLTEVKGKIVASQEENVDRTKIQADIEALTSQITSVVNAAQFNGLNLLNGTDAVEVLSSLDRSSDGTVTSRSIAVERQDLSTSSGALGTGASLAANATASSAAVVDTAVSETVTYGGTIAIGEQFNLQLGDTTVSFVTTTTSATDLATGITDAVNAAGITGITANSAAGVVTLDSTNAFDATSISDSDNSAAGTTTLSDTEIAARAETVTFATGVAVNEGDGYRVSIGGANYDYVAGKNESMADIARGLKTVIDGAALTDITTQVSIDATTGAAILSVDNNGATQSFAATGAADGTATGGLFALSGLDVTSNQGSDAALANVETLIQTAIDAAAQFGSDERRLQIQDSFVSQLTDSLKTGIGALVDADMEEASARLQALQVQQQLGVQSLSIANQAPQSILSLFR